jgi:hypothetical protein
MTVVVTHQRLYGKDQQESMDWTPYLQQLSRKSAALKYTGIYQLLPNQVTDWLNRKDNPDRGKALKLLHDLTSKSSFPVAVDALQTALDYSRSDPESIVAIHASLISDIPELPPVTLPPSVTEGFTAKRDITQYDKAFMAAGGEHAGN